MTTLTQKRDIMICRIIIQMLVVHVKSYDDVNVLGSILEEKLISQAVIDTSVPFSVWRLTAIDETNKELDRLLGIN